MPRGPNGEWRPADPVAAGVHIGKLATHEIEETFEAPPRPDPVDDSRRASAAAKARAAKYAGGTPRQREARIGRRTRRRRPARNVFGA